MVAPVADPAQDEDPRSSLPVRTPCGGHVRLRSEAMSDPIVVADLAQQLVAGIVDSPAHPRVDQLRQYAPELAAAAWATVGDPLGPQVVTPTAFGFIHAGVIWRETRGGVASGLHPLGPRGSGDWTARAGHWTNLPHVRLITTRAALPVGWSPALERVVAPVSGAVSYVEAPFPWAIPADYLGWGRGLGQIDAATWWAWLQLRDEASGLYLWQLPGPNLLKSASILLVGLQAFPSNRKAGCAGYNARIERIQQALAAGHDPDSVTTGGDYAAEVLRNATAWSGLALA
jgi:hypothetical protein